METILWEDAVQWLREQPHQVQLVKDCYFDLPVIDAAERFWQSAEWRATREIVGQNKGTALDVGAGNGIASYSLAKDGWLVDALEPDPSDTVGTGAISALAKRSDLAITISQEFGENLPYNDNHFDLVYARQVLHHAKDLPQFCQELHRVTKPGGMLFTARDHVISQPNDLNSFLKKHPLHHLYGGENAFTLNQYRESMTNAGFKIEMTLRPFDSVINFAPLTLDTLRQSLIERTAPKSMNALLSICLKNDTVFKSLCTILSRVDRRPGRLFSFVARKPSRNG